MSDRVFLLDLGFVMISVFIHGHEIRQLSQHIHIVNRDLVVVKVVAFKVTCFLRIYN